MKTHMLRINEKLIILNDVDPLKYMDMATMKIHHYEGFHEGDKIRAGTRVGRFIRVIVPKRDPWTSPQKAIVQFESNKGVSQVHLTDLRPA